MTTPTQMILGLKETGRKRKLGETGHKGGEEVDVEGRNDGCGES